MNKLIWLSINNPHIPVEKVERQVVYVKEDVAQNNGIPPKHAPAYLDKNVFETRKGSISNACASFQNAQQSPIMFVYCWF